MRQRPAGGRRPLRLLWSSLVAASALIIVLGGPAIAHDVLESSDPTDGSTLTSQPTQVLLTFSAEQLDLGAAVQVTGVDGAEWAEGEVVIADRTLTQPLRDGMPTGAYTVQWRSVSSDGHPIDGAFAFTLDLPEPVAEGAAPTVETEPEVETPAETEQPEQGTTSPAPGTPDEPGAPMSPLLVVGLALGASALAVTVLVLLRRKGQE